MISNTKLNNSALYEALGLEIADARVIAGIDRQAELAKRMNCSQQTVSRWEAGTSRPRATQIPLLARALNVDPDRLLDLAGYATATSVVSYAQPFPVNYLDPETFERFVEYLLALLHPDAKIDRAGSLGHKQDGLDLTVTWPNGERHSYQCKRVTQFGPAEVSKAIKAHIAAATKKHLVLSRVASPQARAALRMHPDWELWDKENISQLIRLKLSGDDQNKLVDIFFRGQRLALLGRSEAGPWMVAHDFFAPFDRRGVVFSHQWHLRGRENEIAELSTIIEKANTPVVLVTGPGGIGKSRLLKEVIGPLEAKQPGTVVRFLSTSVGPTREGLDALGSRQKVLVVDDAHDRDDLGMLLEYAADQRNRTQLVLSSRLYAVARIQREAAIFGIGDIPQILLKRLTDHQMVDLVEEVLMEFGGDPLWAKDITKVAHDCPLVAVMAARVMAREGLVPELVKHDQSLRTTILGKFSKVVTGELGSLTDQQLLQETLGVLALIQPFHVDDPQIIGLLRAINGMAETDSARILKLLVEGGIIYRRGHQYRLMPDLLGDYIIETRCIGLNERLTSFAKKVFRAVPIPLLSHVLVNLGRLDWRRSGGKPSASRLLDEVWESLESAQKDHDLTFDAVRSVAIYQPRQALQFVQRQIGASDDCDRGKLSQIIRNVAYNYEYLDNACELLWELGRDDKRPLGQNPSHAIRVLSELCGYNENKAVEFVKRVFEFGFRLIEMDDVWESYYSPLDILSPILSGEGVNTSSTGRQFVISPFLVNYDVVAPLRKQFIVRILALLSHPDLRVGRRAAKILEQALRAPMGVMGSAVPPEIYQKYQNEFLETLEATAKIVASGSLHPVIAIRVAKSVLWHAQHGKDAPATAAQKILDVLPRDLDFRTRAALFDGSGQIFLRKFNVDSYESDQKGWIDAISAELKTAFPDAEKLRRYLEHALSDLLAIYDHLHSAHVLIFRLLDSNLSLSQAFIADADTRPQSKTSAYVTAALSEVLNYEPEQGRIWARRFLNAQDVDLAARATSAFGSLRRAISADDLGSLSFALASREAAITLAGVRVLWSMQNVAQRTRVDLVKKVCLNLSPSLADEVARLFSGSDHSLLNILDKADVEHLLKQMLHIPRLDGYWLQELLIFISRRFPRELAEFFFQRVEFGATAERFDEFRPANHGPYAHAKLMFSESSEVSTILQTTWAWLRKNVNRDIYFQCHAADVFDAMFLSSSHEITQMLDLFESRVEDASAPELQLMSQILRKASHDFIFTYRAFIVRFLKRCENFGQKVLRATRADLFASAISGVRSGIVGEPTSRDVQMLANAKQALKQVSLLSPAYDLYEDVRLSAVQDIERAKRDAEAFDD